MTADLDINTRALELQVPACMLWPVPSRYVQRKPAAHEWKRSPRLKSWQRGRCAMCGFKETDLVEDHCHVTGLVRGWLCRSCNVQEGVSDAPRFVRWRAGWNPCSLLGIEQEYHSTVTGRLVLNWQGLRLRMTDEQRAVFDRNEPVELDIYVDVLNEAKWPHPRVYQPKDK